MTEPCAHSWSTWTPIRKGVRQPDGSVTITLGRTCKLCAETETRTK